MISKGELRSKFYSRTQMSRRNSTCKLTPVILASVVTFTKSVIVSQKWLRFAVDYFHRQNTITAPRRRSYSLFYILCANFGICYSAIQLRFSLIIARQLSVNLSHTLTQSLEIGVAQLQYQSCSVCARRAEYHCWCFIMLSQRSDTRLLSDKPFLWSITSIGCHSFSILLMSRNAIQILFYCANQLKLIFCHVFDCVMMCLNIRIKMVVLFSHICTIAMKVIFYKILSSQCAICWCEQNCKFWDDIIIGQAYKEKCVNTLKNAQTVTRASVAISYQRVLYIHIWFLRGMKC